jgi:hypothetical protein
MGAVPDGVAEDSVLEETARPGQNNAFTGYTIPLTPTSKIDTMGDVVPLRLAVTL